MFSMLVLIQLSISMDWKRHWLSLHRPPEPRAPSMTRDGDPSNCTLQTAEAERVMKLIHAIPGYDSLANFCCLTDWEKDQVFSHYRRKNNITGGDASMGTDADAKPGDESSAHPGEEEADEPANDPTDVVRDSENSGKQQLLDALGKLFTVSEDVNVCLYCGSTQHGHLECEHEKRDEVRKVLKAVRASLEADSPTSDDVDMEPPEHKKDGSGATDGSGQTDEPTKSRFGEHQWYDSIRNYV